MDFDLTEEQKMIQDTISKFAKEEIAPVASENDKKAQFPQDIFKKLAEFLGKETNMNSFPHFNKT